MISRIAGKVLSLSYLFHELLYNFTLLFFCTRYPDDMGPLRAKNVKNKGMRIEPILETRIKDYTEFFNRQGVIENEKKVITCIKGGGIAMITSLPEVIEKKCKRMNIAYKLGDVTIIVDILEKLTSELDINNPKPEGTVEFIKNVTGKLLQRTILLSDVVLPSDLDSIAANQVIVYETLGPEIRFNGLNVIRLQRCDLESIRESDIFSILEH